MMEIPVPLQTIVLAITMGAFANVIANRFRIPSIVLYLAIGVLLGKDLLQLIQPESLGQGLNYIIVIFVSIILFEGGLSLDLKCLQRLRGTLLRQLIIGIVLTMLVAWIAGYFIMELSELTALIFASLTVVTGPTVISPILKRIQVSPKVKTLLNGEAVIIDAIGAILAIVIIGFVAKQGHVSESVLEFFLAMGIGSASGLLLGFGAKLLLRFTPIKEFESRSIFVLGILFASYFLAERIHLESGIVAVAVLGLVLSSLPYRYKEELINFKDQLTRITISILFILLAAGFNLELLKDYWWQALLVVFALILIRFVVVFFSTRRTDFSQRERFFIGWVGPRGIIALSVASIASLRLSEAGFTKDAPLIEILIFVLISITVIGQGLTASTLAKKLKITIQGDGDLVILGVNSITLEIAKIWREHKAQVLFIDSLSSNCKRAENEGFPVLQGNGLDPRLYQGIDLALYKSVLAATSNSELNTLFCQFCKDYYGIKNLYTTLTDKASEDLNTLISDEDIRLAFVHSKHVKDKEMGFFQEMLRFILQKKKTIAKIIIADEALVGKKSSDLQVTDDMLILAVVREDGSTNIFHKEFEFKQRDELYIYMDESKVSGYQLQLKKQDVPIE